MALVYEGGGPRRIAGRKPAQTKRLDINNRPSGTKYVFAFSMSYPPTVSAPCARREPNSRSERRQSQTWEMIAAVRNELKNHDDGGHLRDTNEHA